MFYSVSAPEYDDIVVRVRRLRNSLRTREVFHAQGTADVAAFCEQLEAKGYKFGGYSSDHFWTTEKPHWMIRKEKA